MFDPESTIHRRGFIGSLVAGAAAAGLAAIPGGNRLIAEPEGADTKMFDSALKKISSRKYKQVFDAPRPNESMPVIWSWAFLLTHNQMGIDDKDVGCFVILRHEAIPLAMEDKLWAKYKFGEVFKIEDKTTKAPSLRNVVTHIKPDDLPLPDMAMEKVQARGVLFGVCELAITVYSMVIAQKMGLKPDDVKKDWMSGLLPGIVPLPSGVWAVNRAQTAGLTYCFAG